MCFFQTLKAAYSAVGSRIWLNFKLLQAPMHVIITCKYKKERMKKSREKVETLFFPIITLSCTMENSGRIWPNFKLIQALMYLIITCKYQKDPIKNSREKINIIFPIIRLWGFFRRSRAAKSAVSGPIRPKFELVRALMHVIVTCKFEKEWMKNSRE